MAIKRGSKYYCSYCNRPYAKSVDADVCREKHDLVYIALSRSDLGHLLQFIHLRQEEHLTESLVNNLRKYLRGSRR